MRGFLFAALGVVSLTAPLARAQGFGPDTATPSIPADSGGSVVIAPQNNGSVLVAPANQGENSRAAPRTSTVVTNSQGSGAASANNGTSLGTNAILPGDEQAGFEQVPDIHLVRRGDTLWDLCNHYYQNPWAWPKVWSYNPQIANPHWIYPGDQVRLTSATGGAGMQALSLARKSSTIGSGGSLLPKTNRVNKDTVFLRDQGYLGDPKRDVWGEIIGSDEEQQMLADGNHVVLSLRPGATVSKGQELTVFSSV